MTVGPGDRVDSLAQRLPFPDLRVERFCALNGLAPNDRVRAGERVKIVVEIWRANRS